MVRKFPSQEMDRFNVRMPNGMRDAIAERAKRNGRSMNSEILQVLQDALDRGEHNVDTEPDKVYCELTTNEMKTGNGLDKIDSMIEQLALQIDADSKKICELLNLRKVTQDRKSPS